ncbi:unnamed protein product [Zymoseptoria tritici ST99CH_1E4]|uniref:Uncharacterized protein n=1 Tax=Zymoseptoria tritici ST99CH_1E4 TaxID=1276532 RepID=A0A2H1GBN5_ZYMTR|nr:unnamed protein product [Zymoseptoria tritici ST99CH_1E4]
MKEKHSRKLNQAAVNHQDQDEDEEEGEEDGESVSVHPSCLLGAPIKDVIGDQGNECHIDGLELRFTAEMELTVARFEWMSDNVCHAAARAQAAQAILVV